MSNPKQPTEERVIRLPLSEMHPFKGYPALAGIMPRAQPYVVQDDDPAMVQLRARVQERGIRVPGIVRPDPDGGYEIISGHRRHRACELENLATMPVIIRDMTDEEAVRELVDSNIQRENVKPSERAWAYRMLLEAEQAARKAAPHNAARTRTDDDLGLRYGVSGDTLRRWASLTKLHATLMKMVDEKQLGVTPAFSLAVLSAEQQAQLLDAMDYAQAIPSTSQAQRIKKAASNGTLTADMMKEILSEEKKADVDKVIFSTDAISKYFPKSYTPLRMQETILKLLEQWQRKRERSQER